MDRKEIEQVIAGLGLTATYKFIPWSQSRNKAEKYPSLNYEVTLRHDNRDVLTTDYMMGSGHAPAYKCRRADKWLTEQAIKSECETGRKCTHISEAANTAGYVVANKGPEIFPELIDVVYSLQMDADTIDYTFESWCNEFGYDTDSRKAEAIYNQCVQIAIKLRQAIGEDGLNKLRDAYQDY